MTDWTDIGRVSDFALGTATRVQLGEQAIAVVATQEGLFAVSDVCSHAEVSLSEGEVDDCAIECWLHGSRFNLRTGLPSGPPATQAIATFELALTSEENPTVSIHLNA
jgi:3-phenylpropionate/trans-cinnamate dioxygenase ferredoxin component